MTRRNTRAALKIAIHVPVDLLEATDRAARERGESRSRYISHVLHAAAHARSSAEITRRLDSLFADESVADEQRRGAIDLDRAGADWSDERW